MTQNVLTYLQTLETERTNRAKEQETNRSNLAKEAENYRYNTEYLTELNRSNTAKENISRMEAAEKKRANQANEGIKMYETRLADQRLSFDKSHASKTESQTDVDLARKEKEYGIKQGELSVKEQEAATKQFEAELKKLNLSKSIIEDIAALAFRIFGLTY